MRQASRQEAGATRRCAARYVPSRTRSVLPRPRPSPQLGRLGRPVVVRTSPASERLGPADTVRTYQRLSTVECAFRSFRTVDLNVRSLYP